MNVAPQPRLPSALEISDTQAYLGDVAEYLVSRVNEVNNGINSNPGLRGRFKPLTFREALFFLLRSDKFRLFSHGTPRVPSGVNIPNYPRLDETGGLGDEIADLISYLADIHFYYPPNPDVSRPTDDARKRALETIENIRAIVADNKEDLGKKIELVPISSTDTLSKIGYKPPGDSASQAGENEYFFEHVKQELFAERANLHYLDEKGQDVQLLEFTMASEQNYNAVLKSINNLVTFAVRNSRLVPYESIARQLAIKYPGLTDDQKKQFMETALKWAQSSLPAAPLVRAAEEIQASGVADNFLKPFVEMLTFLVRNKVDPNVPFQLSTLLSQARLVPADLPVLVDTARDVVRSQASLPVLLNLARAVSSGGIKPEELFDASSRVDVRLRQERQIKDLEAQLEKEREHTEMKDALQQALAALPDEGKATAQAALEVLRSRNFLSRIALFRDMAIWMSQQGAPVNSPEQLWARIKQYSDIKSELDLVRDENSVRADLRDLLKLLDDNLLQPKRTLQLLRSLLSDPDTSDLGAVTNTIHQLKQRNSDLSSSFRETLVAMGSLLQVFNSVSQKYAFHVLEFMRSFSVKVVETTTKVWKLEDDNPVAQFAKQLADTFANNYYVEVKVDQKIESKTLDLTLADQKMSFVDDAVFLHSASLFRWLDRFSVDPKRPADSDMARLWDQAAEHLYDWQQQVIRTFQNTDVAGQSRPVKIITDSLLNANSQFFSRAESVFTKTTQIARDVLNRFGQDLAQQEESLRRRIESLWVAPALSQYVLTINGQDAKQEAARAMLGAFIDAVRNRVLDGKPDDIGSAKIRSEIDGLAFDLGKLELEAKAKDGEYKRLQSEHKKLQDDQKVTNKELADIKSDVATATTDLQKYAPKVNASVVGNLPDDVKRTLEEYEKARKDYSDTKQEVSAVVAELKLLGIQASTVLANDMRETLKQLKEAYKDRTAAKQVVGQYTQQDSALFQGFVADPDKLAADITTVLKAYQAQYRDNFAAAQLVSQYAQNDLLLFAGFRPTPNNLTQDVKKVVDAYQAQYKDYTNLVADERKWWDVLHNVRYPVTRGQTAEETKEMADENKQLSPIANDTLRLLAERRAIVTKWVASIADLVKDNDLLTVKDLINKAQGKPGSKGSSSAAASKAPASASANPYYRVRFNGEVDTLADKDKFPVFLPQTPFMRLWMFAREFAGAASNQLGNILEPLAPGLEIDDERTLFILRQYQLNFESKNPADPPKDIPNPTLPTGASRTEVAKQQLADDEEKKDLKETAEERRKKQETIATDYIKQLDEYRNLDEYEIKVRQYFKNIALNALVHCQEMLQRTDLPEFRRITLAELINSSNLSSGFARMCGLYTLVKQGTVPGMISTQSSEANRSRDFLNHARDLPRMYRRKGPYVWEVVRVPSITAANGDSNKRLRL